MNSLDDLALPRCSCLWFAAPLFALVLAGCGESSPADLVLHGGAVITFAEGGEQSQAIAIRDGRIVAVGSDSEVLTHVGDNTRSVDLGGRTVVPGLTDNHFHSLGGGPGVDLSGARSLQEVIASIRERAEATPEGEVVVTNSNWHEGQLAEQTLPLRDDLDRASSAHPIVVVRGGHEYILNSAALDKWGIQATDESPPGGRIGRYADGRLNGELVDRAKDPVELPRIPAAAPEASLLSEIRVLSQLGITSVRIPGGSAEQFALFERLAESGQLDVRVDFLFRPRGIGPEGIDDAVASWGAVPDYSTEMLTVGGVKLGVDGGFEGGLMREPYLEPWGQGGTFFGLQTRPTDGFKTVVQRLNELGWRVATHAVGDAAIDLVLDAYEETNEERSLAGRRWTIEHGFIPAPDQFERMRALGLTVTAQNHLYLAAPSLVQYWGAERTAYTTPVGLYVQEQVPVSLGTDSPVIPYNPFWVLYHFATRGTISAGIQGAEYAVGRLEALRLMTEGYAYQVFAETEGGSLQPGMRADLAVLSGDYLAVPDEEIQELTSVLTVVGGRVVHDELVGDTGGDR
ncbi:MAG: amidohydrolase [Longimicrobiales bacterium]